MTAVWPPAEFWQRHDKVSSSSATANAAVRLLNGHTLVTFMNQPRAVELDRSGKEVWDYKAEGRVTRLFGGDSPS
jgi:hypothetical protein